MNINQNIVRIRTGTQIGSGIIYPCEACKEACKEYKYKPWYIIFTNRHLVKDLTDISDKNKLKKMVAFDIYDQTGKLVGMDLILDIRLFTCQNLSKEDKEKLINNHIDQEAKDYQKELMIIKNSAEITKNLREVLKTLWV